MKFCAMLMFMSAAVDHRLLADRPYGVEADGLASGHPRLREPHGGAHQLGIANLVYCPVPGELTS
jgi:hypothetical protein